MKDFLRSNRFARPVLVRVWYLANRQCWSFAVPLSRFLIPDSALIRFVVEE